MDISTIPAIPGVNVAPANPNNTANVPLAYTSIVPVQFQLNGGTSAFVTTNIASAVPAQAVIIDLQVVADFAAQAVGARKTGSGLARTWNLSLPLSFFSLKTEISGQQVDLFDSGAGHNNYYIINGYWS